MCPYTTGSTKIDKGFEVHRKSSVLSRSWSYGSHQCILQEHVQVPPPLLVPRDPAFTISY